MEAVRRRKKHIYMSVCVKIVTNNNDFLMKSHQVRFALNAHLHIKWYKFWYLLDKVKLCHIAQEQKSYEE